VKETYTDYAVSTAQSCAYSYISSVGSFSASIFGISQYNVGDAVTIRI